MHPMLMVKRLPAMAQQVEPKQVWGISASATYGGLAGIAAGVVHQIYSSFSMEIPDNVYVHVVGATLVGAFSGAVLFASVALFRNWLKLRL
jgi:hypothetical protein